MPVYLKKKKRIKRKQVSQKKMNPHISDIKINKIKNEYKHIAEDTTNRTGPIRVFETL